MRAILFIFILNLLVLQSCRNDVCLEGTGKYVSIETSTNPFTELIIDGIYNVLLIQDTVNFYTISAGENIQTELLATEAESSLRFKNETKCYMFKHFQKPVVEIHFTDLHSLILNEACSVYTNAPITNNLNITVNADFADISIELQNDSLTLNTQHKAGGEFVFSGSTNVANLKAKYVSRISAIKLQSKEMKVYNETNQDFTVWVTETLFGSTTKNGVIYYKGNPIVTKKKVSDAIEPFVVK